jgi:superfamily II DNA or RNA helicase
MSFSAGMTVQCRGQRCVVLDSSAIPGEAAPTFRVRVRAIDGPLRNQEWPVIYPLEPIAPESLPSLSLDRVGRDARFRLLHEAFMLTLAPPPSALVAAGRSRIRFESYQQIPALRMLSLPRPRVLNASDVGLGKTIETGIALRELIARRRANRILIVCPAGITEQWQEEMASKFGLDFKIFDRDGVHQTKQQIEVGGNPWAVEPRIIASFDYLKRRDGAFREVQHLRFNVVVCDEAHHLADNTLVDDISERYRLAQWIAKASDALILLSATPHSGYDESFFSLLNLLEPTLVPDSRKVSHQNYSRYLIRHLKRHIKNSDGTSFFVLPEPSIPLPVKLTLEEDAVHGAVADQAGLLDEQAEKVKSAREKYALRLVATILRKRAASSLAALQLTVDRRIENLEKSAEDIELRRDHLRSLRRGETIPDDALTQLEIDAHRSYLARIREAGTRLRTIEQEMQDLLELKDLLARCPGKTESKAEALRAYLQSIHQQAPDEKVIVFSEYFDTIEWLAAFLAGNGYEGKFVRFDGTLSGVERKKALADFAKPETVLLLSTDAASEGLNLQDHCHRVIHYELPFNPNRMLQRQGRVDRYGQTKQCQFAFLYGQGTYEGEVLKRLFLKIERQITRLGSVGDVLGALQAERVEQLLSRSPSDVRAAIEEADRQIDEELASVDAGRVRQLMGDGDITESEGQQLEDAIEVGRKLDVDVVAFVVRAITLAGGRCERKGEVLTVSEVPLSWVGGKVPTRYDALYVGGQEAPRGTNPDEVLDDNHPLVQAAIRWIRESRYKASDDHRMAARLVEDIEQPDVITTFIATVRAADNTEVERLVAVRAFADGTVSPTDALSVVLETGITNVPSDRVQSLFDGWWESACGAAERVACERSDYWKEELRGRRFAERGELKARLEEWNRATRAAILHGHKDPGTFLPGLEKKLPPTTARRLREHRKEFERQQEFLERRLNFEAVAIEPLGVLLRVPAKEVK